MKIVQIISNLGNGGAEKFTIELSNELAKSNEVTLVTFKNITNEMIFPRLLSENVKLIELSKKSGFSFTLYFRLLKILRSEKPKVVHFHLDATFKYVFLLSYFFSKIHFIYTIHTKPIPSNISIFSKISPKIFHRKNVYFVCISQSIQREFGIMFPQLTFHCIENGILRMQKTDFFESVQLEVDALKKNDDTKVLVAVGKIDAIKNHLLLLKAMQKLRTENVIALVIGEFLDTDKEYHKQIEKNKTENVYFLSKRKNVIDYLLQSNAFAMTSVFEGLPISALEAMSVGLPIITTPCGGMIDLIENNVSGWISEDFSEGEFTKIIKNFLSSPTEKVENISKNNKLAYDERYTMKKCAENYYKLYKNA